MRLAIPLLGVEADIVGVPLLDDGWDVSWLWSDVGYLNGTAFPTWNGNSVITGHVSLPNGQPGPLVGLEEIRFGDRVVIHAWGLRYIYEVRTLNYIPPEDRSVFDHKDLPWITLVTCDSYDEATDSYRLRVSAGAVLVAVEEDDTPAEGPESQHLWLGPLKLE